MAFKKLRLWGALAVGTTIALLAAGCSAATPDASNGEGCAESYTIGFSHPVGEIVAIQAVKKFAEERASELECVELLLDNTTGGNIEAQRATIESWVVQQVDAIVIFPVDVAAFASIQKTAQEQGTKWLTYASQMEGEDGSVGWDGVLSGTLIADDLESWLADNYPEGDLSAAVTSYSPIATLFGHAEMPIERLEELGVPVVLQQDCVDQTCGLQLAENALREHPDLRVFVGMNDDAAVGAMKAFANAGIAPEEVYIAGQDGSEEALQAVLEGTYYKASAAIKLAGLGASVVDNALAAISGEGDPFGDTELVLATNDNPELVRELLATYE